VTVDAGQGNDSLNVSGTGSDQIILQGRNGMTHSTMPGSGYQRNDTLVPPYPPVGIQLTPVRYQQIVGVPRRAIPLLRCGSF